MSFTSYAANFEDVILWRAFRHLDSGVYVDIDARGPTPESVGRAFRERGWKGVHVVQGHAPAGAGIVMEGRIGRPVPLTASAEAESGSMAFVGGCAQEDSMPDAGAAPVPTLDALFDRIGAETIHWMRLDLGQMACNPFEGWYRSTARPWVLLVSHAPAATGEDEPPHWESQLLAKGYRRACADSVNRYYVDADRNLPGLASGGRASAPPETPAVRIELARAELALQELQRKLFDAQAGIVQLEERAVKAEAEVLAALTEARQVAVLQRQLHDVYASTSWRITRPMRWVSRLRRSPRAALGELVAMAGRNLRRVRGMLMHRAINAVLARPALQRVALWGARHFPKLLQRYKRDIKVVMAAAPAPGHSNHTTVIGPRFRTLILDELQGLDHPSQQGKA